MLTAETKRGATALFNLHECRARTWNSRAEAAVDLWASAAANDPGSKPETWKIADLGCGDEKLRSPLARTGIAFEYSPYDKLPQSPTCRQLDVASSFPVESYDLVFCLGLLEYLTDVPEFLRKLRKICPRAIVGYTLADSHAYTPDDVAVRGWLHHFSAAEIEAMFARAGFEVHDTIRIDESRTALWRLEAKGQPACAGDYAMLTPFPIPPQLNGSKVRNLGDGFIERAILDRLAPHQCRVAYSSRVPLTDDAIECINETKLLVLVGANQLNDNFTIVPDMTPERFARIRVPVVPMGMGFHGIPSFTQRMSSTTQTLLRLLHERIRYSSWRCPRSVEYLLKYCPEIADQALMTGCPVIFREPLLNGQSFPTTAARLVVTVTERHDFWRRETQTIDFVSRQFPAAEKTLSLHQVYPPSPSDHKRPRWWKRLMGREPKTAGRLSEYARRRGFTLYAPDSVAECQEFYDRCDLHVGSRLHAHLYFLSQAKPSFLSYVDDRSAGMAEAAGFPLCDPARWRRHLDYDFEQCRIAARRCHQAMARFHWSVKELLT